MEGTDRKLCWVVALCDNFLRGLAVAYARVWELFVGSDACDIILEFHSNLQSKTAVFIRCRKNEFMHDKRLHESSEARPISKQHIM